MNVLSCILSGNVKQKITDKTSISVDHEAKIWDVLMNKILNSRQITALE
jgi:hypothetical protein